MTGIQYKIGLDRNFAAETGYAFYSFLLESLPASVAEEIHDAECKPLSQFVYRNTWYISAFQENIADALSGLTDDLERIDLRSLGRTAEVTGISYRIMPPVEKLLETERTGRFDMRLCTPCAFKRGGAYQLLPEQELVIRGLVRRWNGLYGMECPIEDEGEGLEALAEELIYHKIELSTEDFRIKNTRIPGTVGKITAQHRSDGFHNRLGAALLEFGTYTGVGIKTALGMGGIQIDSYKHKAEIT